MKGIPKSEGGELQSLSVQTNLRLKPPTVSQVDPVSVVLDTMIKEDIGAIVVVDESQPVGIITEKDDLVRIVQPQKDFELTLAKDVMSKLFLVM